MVGRLFPVLVRDAGVPADMPFRLVYDTEVELLAQEYAARTGSPIEYSRQVWQGSTGVGMSGALMIRASAPSWSGPQIQEWMRAKTMAHEIYHVVQHAWIGGDLTGRGGDGTVPVGGPRWLIEGSAEIVGYRAAKSAGFYEDYERERAWQIARVKETSIPLRELELLDGLRRAGQSGYPLGFIACELLTRDRGLGSLGAYWRAIAGGQTWQAAFAASFGRSVDAFYAEFESYRAGL